MKKGLKSTKSKSFPGSIAVGTAVSIAAALIGAAIIAILIESGSISPGAIRYGVMIMLLASSLAGAIAASTCFTSKRMIVCVIASICFFVTLLCVTAMFFDGTFTGIPATALLVIGGGIIAGLIPAGHGKKQKTHIRRKRYG